MWAYGTYRHIGDLLVDAGLPADHGARHTRHARPALHSRLREEKKINTNICIWQTVVMLSIRVNLYFFRYQEKKQYFDYLFFSI